MAITGRNSSKSEDSTGDTSSRTGTERRPARSRKPDDRSAPPAPVKAKSDDPVLERIATEDDAGGGDTAGSGDAGGGPVNEALAASQSDLAKLQKARRSRLIKAIVLTAIALVFITFILQNAAPIDLRILAWTVSVGLIWVLVAAAVLGALAGYLVGRPPKHLLLHGPSRRQEDTR